MYVSPTQINTQMPFEVNDASSGARGCVSKGRTEFASRMPSQFLSCLRIPEFWGRRNRSPSRSRLIMAAAMRGGIIRWMEPRKRTMRFPLRSGRPDLYLYGEGEDTLETIHNAFIQLINANESEEVTATAAGLYTRIVLRAKIPGPEGQGLTYSAKGTDTFS